MIRLMVVLGVMFIVGCAKEAELSSPAGKEFTVDRLFKHDGCTVYRFYDSGNTRYFTNCHGSTQWSESCGKGCVRQIEIPGGAG